MSRAPQGKSWTGAVDVAAVQGKCPYGLTYRKGCKCTVCRATIAHYMQNTRRRQAERMWGVDSPTDLVDMDEAREAITVAHKKNKITQAEISRVTNVSRMTISEIYNGRREKITRSIRDRILDAYGDGRLTPRSFTDNQLIDVKEVHWKVLCLMAQGWTAKQMQQMLKDDGRNYGFLDHMCDKERIQYRHTKQIDWLVQQIGDRTGPSNMNRKQMANRGIFPLIHYTEDGKLIRGSLTKEQLEAWQRVR